uniref:Reverse transcriptase domain-containing protein n=1 Tax=Magallana gigas TaxID=29159 RepID=A0A8W8LXB8_MAGGI
MKYMYDFMDRWKVLVFYILMVSDANSPKIQNIKEVTKHCLYGQYKDGEVCKVCPAGYTGVNCSQKCTPPSYGFFCSKTCYCSYCHHEVGCMPTTEFTVNGYRILGYADDHSAYDSFNPKAIADEKHVITNLENVLVNINDWMNLNRLKLNPSKTKFVLFGSPQMLSLSSSTSINVVGASVNSSVCIKYLGCYLDEHLTFKKFVSEKCKTISLNLFLINNIRQYLTIDSCKQIVQSLVTSHLDYANSVLYGLPECTIKRLQLLQNRAAKLVLKWKSTDSSTEALKRLHWLPVYFRIRFKIACVVYKCLNDSESPIYLREMLSIRESPYSIRSISSVAKTLNVPAVKRKTFAARSFAISGPTVWNELPTDMRTIRDFTTFKRQLKAFYYKCAF